ncbi:hypothetical protein Mal4_13050 [Maioricimonas rarisocia]|uniref:HD domain-containing protein n=1 Tax=Maioricimonas rarisocia TaxID=2528026 RepID=A0A517Z3D0_9PLAN|nr:HD domain-containing protein [Maioricimonas rarisocia]QDU37002.1 hypothetical protein Mal4_13050 [Maioricimonas rarisocia]
MDDNAEQPDGVDVDLQSLWRRAKKNFALDSYSIHGPSHWKRVEQNGVELAEATPGADLLVVRMFAVFHDCERHDDGHDPEHGPRAAALIKRKQGKWFQLPDETLELLCEACRHHTHGGRTEEPTIGCCWDADRLDLTRIGVIPHARFMSTEAGRMRTVQD